MVAPDVTLDASDPAYKIAQIQYIALSSKRSPSGTIAFVSDLRRISSAFLTPQYIPTSYSQSFFIL